MKTYNIASGEVSSDVRFATAYDRPVGDFEEHPVKESQTETAYVPPQVQIADMMDAGVRLAAARRARFDSTELGEDLAGPEVDLPLDP